MFKSQWFVFRSAPCLCSGMHHVLDQQGIPSNIKTRGNLPSCSIPFAYNYLLDNWHLLFIWSRLMLTAIWRAREPYAMYFFLVFVFTAIANSFTCSCSFLILFYSIYFFILLLFTEIKRELHPREVLRPSRAAMVHLKPTMAFKMVDWFLFFFFFFVFFVSSSSSPPSPVS